MEDEVDFEEEDAMEEEEQERGQGEDEERVRGGPAEQQQRRQQLQQQPVEVRRPSPWPCPPVQPARPSSPRCVRVRATRGWTARTTSCGFCASSCTGRRTASCPAPTMTCVHGRTTNREPTLAA